MTNPNYPEGVTEQDIDNIGEPIGFSEDDIKEHLICPFCKDIDFDRIELKNHLLSGYCKEFENIEKLK